MSSSAAEILTRLRGEPFTVLIDGRSGSGKTTLAAELAACTGAFLLRLDDVYPGWDGLAAGGALAHDLLLARRLGQRASVHRWDWTTDAAAGELVVPASASLIVEGCGALSRANRTLADLGVWVELGSAERKRRALARDGSAYAPHWDRWAAQEEAFLAAEQPRAHADLEVAG